MSTTTIYAASRASLPDRPAMWRRLRDEFGWPIVSTWIDEAGPGETACFGELWSRIAGEVRACDLLVLYAGPGDLPLKGALVEVGMALGLGKPVAAVLPGVELGLGCRPVGSWLMHPLVTVYDDLGQLAAARGLPPVADEGGVG
jgi:hypothetical protein